MFILLLKVSTKCFTSGSDVREVVIGVELIVGLNGKDCQMNMWREVETILPLYIEQLMHPKILVGTIEVSSQPNKVAT